jgi:hypothetical protein
MLMRTQVKTKSCKVCRSVRCIRIKATKNWYVHRKARHGHQALGLNPHNEYQLGPSRVIIKEPCSSRETCVIRDKGATGEISEEALDVLGYLGEVVVGVLCCLRKGSASKWRRSVVLLVDLVITFSYADVEAEGMLEPLLSLMEVFPFLALSLLRILFLPMMREKMLLL